MRSGDEPTVDAGARPDRPATVVEVVSPDRYTARSEIARGGLGRVSVARDERFGRPVALKEALHGADPERFLREAVITARLQHPGIVPVYDFGRWPDGEPFFAMRRVEGRPLDRVLDAAADMDARLALLAHLVRAAEAIAYAHAHGVIHRDVKPANILVGDYGETVVIDWGLAKARGMPDAAPSAARAAEASDTQAGDVMGTPAYMAPEQAASTADADSRADVFALGAILYHVLTGRPPFVGASLDEVLAQVRRCAPPPLPASAPPALVTIATKAMAKDPAQRYRDASELLADLTRFTTDQLVASHRYTRRELLARFARRHRAALIATTIAVAAIAVIGTVAISNVIEARDSERTQKERAVAERDEADRQRLAAVTANDDLLLAQARSEVDVDPRASLASLARLSPGFDRWAAARTIAADAEARGVPVDLPCGENCTTAISSDGRLIASVRASGEVFTFETGTWRPRQLAGEAHHVNQLELSADGAWLFAAQTDGRLVEWNTADGSQHVLVASGPYVSGTYLRRDGSVAIAYDDAVRVLRPDGSAPTVAITRKYRNTALLDNPRFVIETEDFHRADAHARVLDLETGRVEELAPGRVVDADFSRDGATRFLDGEIRVGGRVLARDAGERAKVAADGALVVTETSGALRVFDVAARAWIPFAATGTVFGFLGDRHVIAVEQADARLALYDLDSGTSTGMGATGYTALSDHWIVGDGPLGLRVWTPPPDFLASASWPRETGRGIVLAASPSGRVVARRLPGWVEVIGPGGTLRLDVPRARAMAISDDEQTLAVVDATDLLHLFGSDGRERSRAQLAAATTGIWFAHGAIVTTNPHGASVLDAGGAARALGDQQLAWVSVGGARVATVAVSGLTTVWDADWHAVTTTTVRPIDVGPAGDFRPYANMLYYASGAPTLSPDGAALVVSAPTLHALALPSGDPTWARADLADCAASFSSGSLVAICGQRAVAVDLATGATRAELDGGSDIQAAAFSPELTRAALALADGVSIVDVASNQRRTRPAGDDVDQIRFDGPVVRVTGDVGVMVIHDDLPEGEALRAWLAAYR